MFKRPGTYAILLIYVIILILNHLFAYTGHFGYDDLHYAELAADLLNGSLNFDDHYAYRFPVIFLTSACYALFGISDPASSLPTLAISLCVLIFVFNILKEHGHRILIIGLSLSTFSNWFLFYSDKLMPDIYVALSVIWALAIIYRYKFKSDKRSTLLYAFLLALSLLFGFISKGTIVLILPLLVFLIVMDIILKRDLRFWGYSLLAGMMLMSLYLLLIWIFTGNLFKRFDAIASNSYLNLCSYDQQSLKILLRRIFLGFFELSIFQSLATGFIFVFATLFRRQGLHFFRMEDPLSFFKASAIILFLSSSFMSISLTSYAPMCLDPRHYLFLVPVAAIPAARIIGDFLDKKKTAIQIIGTLLAVTAISFFLEGESFWKLYAPLTALFAFYYFVKPGKLNLGLFMLLFSVILLLLPLDMINYARSVKYRKQKELVVDQVLNKHRDNLIVSDEVQIRLLSYYSGFQEDQAERFLSFDEFEDKGSMDQDILLLLNRHTSYLSSMHVNDLPVYARSISPDVKPIFRSEDPDLNLYDMQDLPLLSMKLSPLYTTFNDFEDMVPYWKQNEKDISGDIYYQGAKSNLVSGYSSTFDFPVDSLLRESPKDLLVQCKLYYYAEEQNDALLVISIEDSNGATFWESLEMNRYIKAYSNWWPVSFELIIPQDQLNAESRLKIYVRNSDPPAVYIDNFSIKICELID